MELIQDIDLNSRIKAKISQVFNIESSVTGGKTGEPLFRFSGRFRVATERAYEELTPWLREFRLATMFRNEDGKEEIIIVPGTQSPSVGLNYLNILLLILTLLSTLFVGTMMVTNNVEDFLRQPWLGLPFALSVMVILGAHELGHYIAAREYGVPVTLPYFIPMPLGPFGTLGAFISMKAPPPNRRALLTIAVAGPLSGFLLAVPILLLGLSMSPVTALFLGDGVMLEGNSLLYAFLKFVTFGKFLPSGSEDVFLHPIALQVGPGC